MCSLISCFFLCVMNDAEGEATVRPYDADVKQQWTIVGDRIQNRFEKDLVLDVYGNSSLSTKVGQYKFKGSNNQRWIFEMT